jgi:serine/threonine protein kinase/Tfp pilus assembly protein PilF
MALSTQQMARLGELLDQALPLSPAERRAWLAKLPSEELPLVEALREALQADDPDIDAVRSLDRLPAMSAESTSDSIVTEHSAGERLGAYELLRPLGAGGMAEVWLARRADGAFERRVALKIPRLTHVPAEMAERFARECRILATLEYPGIARLYDAGVEANRTPYIAMEYVQGEPLIAWCDSRGLDVRARVDLFLQVLDAVAHAHALGIIHRDLKPSNILVTGQGDVRLLDFGVASLLQAEIETRPLTRIYGRALTPEYASPEMLRGERVDVRSDIYSLGAVLHELLTGVRSGQEPGATTAREVSGELRDIVAKSMAVAPAERYPDVATFAAALGRRSVSASAASSSRDKRTRRYVLAAVVLAAVVGVAAYSFLHLAADSRARPIAAATQGAETTIAVLPFVDLSEKQDRGYLSDGLAEELIDLLTKIPELRVTARASSFALRDRKDDIAAIARQLSVDNVLEGSVRASGSRLKISVQLVRTSDGTAIWSETYDREMKDIFEIQEDVASAVVDALKLRLLAGHAVAADHRTTNLPAYEEYLLGRQYRDGASLERHQRAQAAFQRAVALDPSFAPAHAGIALASADIGSATMQTNPYDVALAEAEEAMALAPRLVEAYVARALVRMNRNWDFVGAKSDLDSAMRIDPNNMELLQAHASFLWITGKLDQALAVQRRLVSRNPLASKTWDWLGVMLMNARDYPAARKALERSEVLSPYSDYRYLLMTLVEIYAGNFQEALRLARANPSAFQRDYTLAMAAFSLGQTAESHAARERLIAHLPDEAASQIAVIYAWQGNEEQAFVWFDRAIALRDPGLFGIQTRPGFDRFKDDPRFQRVLRLMNVVD